MGHCGGVNIPDVTCEKCGEYYKLEEGESPEDFECNCGGKLKNADMINTTDFNPTQNVKNSSTAENKIHNDFKNDSFKQSRKSRYTEPKTEKKYCRECGTENSSDSTFCNRCGKSFNNVVVEQEKTSRTIEVIIGILGGIFGLIGAIAAILVGSLGAAFSASGASSTSALGASALFASILGIAGAAYVLRDAKWGGIVLIISAIWLVISISLFGVLGAVLLGVSGLLALLRK